MKPNNTNKNNKVILNLIQDLQRLPLVLLNNLRGRLQIKSRVTTLCTAPISRIETLRDDGRGGILRNDEGRNGFTLIELLVVVLIIGILAAVALPQYQKAVAKSKATEALTVLSALTRAEEVYYLANNAYTDNIDNLDIDIPLEQKATRWFGNNPNQPGIYMYSCHSTDGCAAATSDLTFPTFQITYRNNVSDNDIAQASRRVCVAALKNPMAESICKSWTRSEPLSTDVHGYYLIDL